MRISSENFRKTVMSSGINLLFRMFGLATSFLSVLLISRLFGVDEFGNYSLVFTVCQACSMIFALGLPNAMIKIVGNDNLDISQARSVLLKGLKIALLIGIFPMIVFGLGNEAIASDIFHKPELSTYFLLVAITLPFSIVHELFLHFFLSTRKFLKYNLFMFVYPNLFLIGLLWLFFQSGFSGYFTFLAFSISSAAVTLIESAIVFTSKMPKSASPLKSRAMLKISSPMMFSSLLLYLLNWTDILMLGPVVSETEIGIYNIAYKVSTVGFLVIVSVSTIITPQIAELYGKGKTDDLRNLVQDSTRLISIVTIPIMAVLMGLGSFILSVFNPEAAQGYTTLLIVSAGVLFSALCGNADQVLNMTNNHIVLRNITFACFLLNVVLNLFLIPEFGINGAASASLFTNIALNLACLYYIRKKLGFSTIRFNFRRS